jgi:hypothetical protein
MEKSSTPTAMLKTVEKTNKAPGGTAPSGANSFIDYILDVNHFVMNILQTTVTRKSLKIKDL